MQYSVIVDRIAQYLDRTDLGTSASSPVSSSKIGCWVNDTRKDLGLKYDFDYLYVEATISTSANSATYALPSDYLGHLTILSENKKLSRIGAREFEEIYYIDEDEQTNTGELELEGDDSSSGNPEYYIDRGMYIQLFPNPDDTYVITMKYFAQPSDFTIGTDEDYMSRFHFEAIIFGAALRGAVFLDDPQKITIFQTAYKMAIDELIKREKEKQVRDTHVRVKSWKDFNITAFKRLMKTTN